MVFSSFIQYSRLSISDLTVNRSTTSCNSSVLNLETNVFTVTFLNSEIGQSKCLDILLNVAIFSNMSFSERYCKSPLIRDSTAFAVSTLSILYFSHGLNDSWVTLDIGFSVFCEPVLLVSWYCVSLVLEFPPLISLQTQKTNIKNSPCKAPTKNASPPLEYRSAYAGNVAATQSIKNGILYVISNSISFDYVALLLMHVRLYLIRYLYIPINDEVQNSS